MMVSLQQVWTSRWNLEVGERRRFIRDSFGRCIEAIMWPIRVIAYQVIDGSVCRSL